MRLEKQFDDEARAKPVNIGRGRPRLIKDIDGKKPSKLSKKKTLGKRSIMSNASTNTIKPFKRTLLSTMNVRNIPKVK